MTQNLRELVRTAAKQLENGSTNSAAEIMAPVEAELKRRGLGDDPHCGRHDLDEDPEATLEWYAGQGVAIIKQKSWFAVNSWLNCVDRFAP